MFPSDDVAETLRAMQKRDLLFIRVSEVILADAPRSVRRRVSDASRNASLDAIRGTAVTCQIHDVISVRYYNDAVASAMLLLPHARLESLDAIAQRRTLTRQRLVILLNLLFDDVKATRGSHGEAYSEARRACGKHGHRVTPVPREVARRRAARRYLRSLSQTRAGRQLRDDKNSAVTGWLKRDVNYNRHFTRI